MSTDAGKPVRGAWRFLVPAVLLALVASFPATAGATDATGPSVGLSADLYSRYVWRGTDIGDSPSIQPTLSVGYAGFELAAWGAYSLSAQSSEHDEIDLWLSHTTDFENGASLGLIVTDYYYPNAGVRFSKSDAHTIELGVSVTGPRGFPLTLSGYVNVANDSGHNTYFELGAPATAGDVSLRFFLGLAGGSKENPDYYDTDTANVINTGVSATKAIQVTSSFSLPLTGAFIYNPRNEMAHLVVGMSF